MRNKSIATAAVIGALMFTSSPALAEEFVNIDGSNPANGVFWEIDEYGIASAGDIDDNFATIYYPNEVYGWSDYFYCGDSGDSASEITVTTEPNGDVTVDCPPVADVVYDGITSTMHFRFYAESDTGYLARQWIEIENTTDEAITLSSGLYIYYYWNYNEWTEGDNYVTSQGNDYAEAGDTWAAGSDIVGEDIATTSAWAASCFTDDFTPDAGYYYPEATNTIAANSTTNLLTFFNIVFPVEASADAAEAAYATVIAQADEYGSLTGRLDDGLPTDEDFVGWNTGACPSANLADTGAPESFTGAVGLGISALALGAVTVVARRRRSS